MADLQLENNPERIKKAEVVVAIPSYNEAERIAYPAVQAAKGLADYFGDRECVLINCDNNSADGTREAFFAAESHGVPKIYLSTPEGVLGKGNNIHNLFAKVLELEAKAVVMVDADLKSITPQWIRHLGEPLLKGAGYVTPLYVRHKYDGTITNSIAYPLTRALYGRRVRQPIGGDFGFSGEMARLFHDSGAWSDTAGQFGIDIWMSTLAMQAKMPICQAYLGRPKVHKSKGQGMDRDLVFMQVVGTAFELMSASTGYWSLVKWSRPTAIVGFDQEEVEMPPPVKLNQEHLAKRFQQGLSRFAGVLESALSLQQMSKIEEIGHLPLSQFDFPTEVWARMLYEFALAYHLGEVDRDELLRSLIPLYFGKTLSYVRKTESMSIQQSENFVENECVVFEQAKPYLLEIWKN